MFDDIIVGSGSAGAVLAARLSEDAGRKVLLLEAGPDYRTAAETAADLRDGSQMSFTEHDWQYQAEAVDGRRVRFPRGRVTGGSSAVGATIALRGVPADFAEWADAGNPAWSWDQVLPYYRKLEHDLDFANDLHGQDGPYPVRRWRPDEMYDTQRAFVDACLAAGYKATEDHNDPDSTGIGPIPSNRHDDDPSVRVNTSMAYLSPTRGRDNLTVRPGVLVDRVLFTGGRASGVVLDSGEEIAGRRVVLAAGAIGSPLVLMRSGIGPRADLAALGIDVRVDAQGVGANLIDHPRSGVFMVPKPGSYDVGTPFLQALLRTTSRVGEFNDLQYYLLGHFDLGPFPELRMLAASPVIFGVMVAHQRPHSRGRMVMTSKDPAAAPKIDLNFLSDEHDVRVLNEGVRTCWDLINSAGIRAHGARMLLVEESGFPDDDVVNLYVKLSLDSTYHPVGTARMGAAGDPDAVVDQFGAVHGTEGLYVADASIMPNIVRCNTNLTSIMIGERIADQLRSTA